MKSKISFLPRLCSQPGKNNRVSLGKSKESKHILSRIGSYGDNYVLSGILFDPQLTMNDAVRELVTEVAWKARALLRVRRFFTVAERIFHFKQHILPFIEFRTPGISHASDTVLAPLNLVQTHFLRELGVSERDAMVHFGLAPLGTRRDVACLGVIHRAVLRRGPPQLFQYFQIDPAPPSLRQL